MIYLEKNPQALKMYPDNRKVNKSHVTRIASAMKQKNLLKDLPILVRQEKDGVYVVDGQHRLGAAILLGAEVYCKKAEIMEKKHISLINSISKKWTKLEYLDHFCEHGKSDYVKLKKFFTQANSFGLGLGVVGKIMMSDRFIVDRASGEKTSSYRKPGCITVNKSIGKKCTWPDFEAGLFEYPENDTFAWDFVDHYRFFTNILPKSFTKTRSFQLAIYVLFCDDAYDADKMKRQIEKQASGVMSSKDANGYIDQLEAVYNYGSTAKSYIRFTRFN